MDIRLIERRLHALLENAPDCVSLLGPDGRFLYTSPAAARINGYSQETFQGQNAFEIIHPEDLPFVERALRRILADPDPKICLEFRLQHRDGSWRWIDAVAVNRLDDPALRGIVVNYRDITDRKRAEEQRQEADNLARANRELEQFAQIVSHDLQEPLRMVESFMQLLADQYGNTLDGRGNEYIAFAAEGASRMKILIADLLAYARAGGRELVRAPADLGGVLDEALANLKVAIEESGALVTADALPALTADRGQLVQLFQNLIGNAIKFHRPGVAPRIHCGARRDAACADAHPGGADWLFTVRDNGVGIDQQHRDRIFEIFQRLQTGEPRQGSGIGLAICRKIVERHGGRIWVDSTPGQGSTFCFTLPCAS